MSPIRVYNMDDWSLHDEFGGNIIGVGGTEYLDLTVDTKRNVYVINIPGSLTGELVRLRADGTVEKELSLGETNCQILSIDYGEKDDVYVAFVRCEQSEIRVMKSDTFEVVASRTTGKAFKNEPTLNDDYSYQRHKQPPPKRQQVRIGTIDQKSIIVLMDNMNIKLFDIGARPLRSYSLYTSAEGRLQGLSALRGVCVYKEGRIVTVGQRFIGFWNVEEKVYRKELRLGEDLAFNEHETIWDFAVSTALDKICVFFEDHLLVASMKSILFLFKLEANALFIIVSDLD